MSNTKMTDSAPKSSVLSFAFSLFKKNCLVILISLVIFVSVSIVLPTIWARAITLIIGLIINFTIIYSYAWREGERDRNFVIYKRIELDINKGLKSGLICNAPLFILSVFVVISQYVKSIPETVHFVFNLLTSSFVLITEALIKINMPYLIPISVFVLPVLSSIGYRHGHALKEIGTRFIYGKKTEKKLHSRTNSAEKDSTNKAVTATNVQRPGEKKTEEVSKSSDRRLRSR